MVNSVKSLRISGLDAMGLGAIASCLARTNSLRELLIYSLNGMTRQCTDSFLKALESNTELE